MPTVICLCDNIYDETEQKRVRGEAFEASEAFIKMVLEGDAEAGRRERITEIKIPAEAPKRGPGRPKKVTSNEDS
jgi:hypothetical protein